MINSLSKDSHMTQSFCQPHFASRSQNKKQSENLNSAVKIGTNSNTNCDSFSKPARNVSFGGFLSPDKLAKNEKFLGTLKSIYGNPLLFDATFALGLTCVLRPGAIFVLPSEKKNKSDNIYAAAHSIASGLISYGISVVVTNPITKAMKKLSADVGSKSPKFLKDSKGYLTQEIQKIGADGKIIKENPNLDIAQTFVKKIPDIFISLPRATITIALIPVILKYVFGIEKKKPAKDTKMTPISQNPMMINQNKINNQQIKVSQNSVGVK